MALIACPECTQQISTLAAACPHCGYPMQANATVQTKLSTPQLRNCPDCGGDGKSQSHCCNCYGSGQASCLDCIEGNVRSSYDHDRMVPCIKCSGTGKVHCTACAGHGSFTGKCVSCDGSGQLTFEAFDVLQNERAEAEAKRKAEEEKLQAEQAQWLAEEPKRAAEEAQRKAEEERTEQGLIQKARQAAKCCINCGGALGIVDSLSGRNHHAKCVAYQSRKKYEGYNMQLCPSCKCATSHDEHILKFVYHPVRSQEVVHYIVQSADGDPTDETRISM